MKDNDEEFRRAVRRALRAPGLHPRRPRHGRQPQRRRAEQLAVAGAHLGLLGLLGCGFLLGVLRLARTGPAAASRGYDAATARHSELERARRGGAGTDGGPQSAAAPAARITDPLGGELVDPPLQADRLAEAELVEAKAQVDEITADLAQVRTERDELRERLAQRPEAVPVVDGERAPAGLLQLPSSRTLSLPNGATAWRISHMAVPKLLWNYALQAANTHSQRRWPEILVGIATAIATLLLLL